jgi:hypothetical protein
MSLFNQIGKMAADDFVSKIGPNLVKDTLIGGGIGGLAGGLYGLINPGQTEEIDEQGEKVVKQKSRLGEALKRGLIGAGIGAGVGGIGGTAARFLKQRSDNLAAEKAYKDREEEYRQKDLLRALRYGGSLEGLGTSEALQGRPLQAYDKDISETNPTGTYLGTFGGYLENQEAKSILESNTPENEIKLKILMDRIKKPEHRKFNYDFIDDAGLEKFKSRGYKRPWEN